MRKTTIFRVQTNNKDPLFNKYIYRKLFKEKLIHSLVHFLPFGGSRNDNNINQRKSYGIREKWKEYKRRNNMNTFSRGELEKKMRKKAS
jgi:hypothetical protein